MLASFVLSSVSNSDGEELIMRYDAISRLISVSDKAGRSLLVFWTPATEQSADGTSGNAGSVISEVRDWGGRFVRYKYQEASRSRTWNLAGASYSDGKTARYGYIQSTIDGAYLLSTADDPRYSGRAKRIGYTYQPSSRFLPVGAIRSEFNPTTGATYVTLSIDQEDPLRREVRYADRVIRYALDSAGRVVEQIDGVGRSVRTEFDAMGRIVAGTGHDGIREEFIRDSIGRVVKTRKGGKIIRSASYDDTGRLLSGTDRAGRRTTYLWDSAGRLVRQVDAAGRVLQLEYDEQGRVSQKRTMDGRTIYVEYDKYGRQTKVSDSSDFPKSSSYDALDRVVEEVDAIGRKTRHFYNELNQRIRTVLPDGRVRSIVYDDYGRIVQKTDELNRRTTFVNDELGRKTRETDYRGNTTQYRYTNSINGCSSSCATTDRPLQTVLPSGMTVGFRYDAVGRLTALIEAVGTAEESTIQYSYDTKDNLVSVTSAVGGTYRYAYNDMGRRISSTDPMGRVTKWMYDDRGNVTSSILPGGAETHHSYDSKGHRISTTSASGKVTRFAYDELGNVSKLIDPSGRVTIFQRNGRLLTEVRFPDGSRETMSYDGIGQLSVKRSAGGLETRMRYDAGGRPIEIVRSIKDGISTTVAFTYDDVGRVVSSTDSSGRIARWTYDAFGNELSVTGSGGKTIQHTYDSHGRRTSTVDQLGNRIHFDYNDVGDVTAIADANGGVYRFTYDSQRRKTSMTYPDGSQESWAYDLSGRVTEYRNRSGQVKTMVYNAANQLLSETWSPGLNVESAPALPSSTTYSYNTSGELSSLAYGSTRLTYGYDAEGRVISETSDLSAEIEGLVSRSVRFGYDDIGRRTSVEYPSSHKVEYAYDDRGLLTSVTSRDGGVRSSDTGPTAVFTYDEFDRLEKIVRDNQTITTYGYDFFGQPVDIVHSKGKQVLASAHYAIDAAGRYAAQRRETGIVESYTYDAIGQLTAVDYGNGRQEKMIYDAGGNLTKRTKSASSSVGSDTKVFTVNALNQYAESSAVARSQYKSNFRYDSNGNNVEVEGYLYTFDGEDRLVSVERKPSANYPAYKAMFVYDAQGRCVLMRVYRLSPKEGWLVDSRASRVMTYDDSWNLLSETDFNGREVAQYVRGPASDQVLIANIEGERRYGFMDAIGSTVALSDLKGSVTERYRYDAFGMPHFFDENYKAVSTSKAGYRVLFGGREWINSLSLSDHRTRHYSPRQGRWLAPDRKRHAGGMNLYQAFSNNPIMFTDPTGENPVAAAIAAALAISLAAAELVDEDCSVDHLLDNVEFRVDCERSCYTICPTFSWWCWNPDGEGLRMGKKKCVRFGGIPTLTYYDWNQWTSNPYGCDAMACNIGCRSWGVTYSETPNW
jgi:RHS repeat-associated protein